MLTEREGGRSPRRTTESARESLLPSQVVSLAPRKLSPDRAKPRKFRATFRRGSAANRRPSYTRVRGTPKTSAGMDLDELVGETRKRRPQPLEPRARLVAGMLAVGLLFTTSLLGFVVPDRVGFDVALAAALVLLFAASA